MYTDFIYNKINKILIKLQLDQYKNNLFLIIKEKNAKLKQYFNNNRSGLKHLFLILSHKLE